ncbi:MAG: IS5 family transposase [Steroidobacteraceae bacterium]
MRGTDIHQSGLFSYVSLESRVPQEHPLRGIKALLDEALEGMSGDFDRVYTSEGRPSIPPERLVRASTLQILYSIRSERLLCEQLDYNLLFRWFVGLSIDEPIWDHSSFTKNRDRLIEAKVARKLLRRIVRKARVAHLLSNEHFSVDGTLIESWAAVKSMRRRDGKDEPPGPGRDPTVDWHGEKRSNETHVAPKDPEAKLFCKGRGQAAKLCYMGHTLMDHRHGLIVDVEVRQADGYAERETAIKLLDRNDWRGRRTVSADKAYDTVQFVADCRDRNITPQVAMNIHVKHSSAIDARTTRHAGYLASQRVRKRIEECFGWSKDGRPLRKMKLYGKRKVEFLTTLTVGIYTMLRVTNLLRAPPLAPA